MMKTTFLAILLGLLLVAFPTIAKEPAGNSGESIPYGDDIHAILQDWINFTEEYGKDSVAWAEVLLGKDGITDYIYLEPGFYEVWGQVDSRYAPEDMAIYIYFPEDGTLIGQTEAEPGFNPSCEFYLTDDREIVIELDVTGLGPDDEAFAAYMMVREGGIDDESRHDYIAAELENLRMYAEVEGSSVIASDMGLLTAEEDTFSFEYELLPGQYVMSVTGGLAMTNVDLTVYDEDGAVIFTEDYVDTYPVGIFELERAATVTVEIIADEFMGEFIEDYYCWCLSSIGDYQGPVG